MVGSLRGIRARVERLAVAQQSGPAGPSATQIVLGLYEFSRSPGGSPSTPVEDPCAVLMRASDECKAAGLPFLSTVLATTEQLEEMLAKYESDAGGREAFARELGREPGWTWRMRCEAV
jgi:hypothetical protein